MTTHLADLSEAGHRAGSTDLRLILVGTIGCGKTRTADTLLGQPASPGSPRTCLARRGVWRGRPLLLVETPRWYWSGGRVEDGVRRETERALPLAAPGPHAFLVLVPVGQFTEVESHVPQQLEEVFGPGALRHALVLLTHGDYLVGRSAEEYLAQEEQGLRDVVQCCGGRYHVINNRRPQDGEQVTALLDKVESMVRENGGCYLQSALQREVEERVRERERPLAKFKIQDVVEVRHNTVTEMQKIGRGKEEDEQKQTMERREREEMETREKETEEKKKRENEETKERVTVKHMANGLHTQPLPQQQEQSEPQHSGDKQPKRSSSFRLTEEGAILSQLSELSEVKHRQNVINTFYHRITTGEDPNPPPSSSSSTPATIDAPSSSLANENASSSSVSSGDASSSFPTATVAGSSQAAELRLVLLGRSGSGKSAAGNAILGREDFESRADSATAVTQQCNKGKAVIRDRRVAVVDTPDWFRSECSPEEVRAQLSSCVALSAPGPHAFLLCVPTHQPAHTELQALGALEAVFGPDAVRRHMLVLFTHADRLNEGGEKGEGGVEKYIASHRPEMLKLVERCGDRYHVLERGSGGAGEEERGNVEELLEKVEQTVRESGGKYYTCPLYQEAESRVRQRQEDIARERRERRTEGREGGQDGMDRPALSAPLHSLREMEEEEVEEEELEQTREEAEKSVRLEDSVPSLSSSTPSASFLRSVWEKVGAGVRKVPKLVAGGALLGGVVGLFFGGLLGGAVGATTGSVVTEVGRRRYSKKKPE